MKHGIVLAALLVLCGVAEAERARYDNYRVYKVQIENEQQLEVLQMVDSNPDGYRFWSPPQAVGSTVELVVPPHKFAEFSELSERFIIKSEKFINNLQEVMDNEQPKNRRGKVNADELDWNGYSTLEEIYDWMTKLVEAHPTTVSSIIGGQTYENRNIEGVKISFKENAPAVFIEANIHAREWISGATATFIINEVINSQDVTVRALVEQFDWYVIPIANPDGFVYTHTTDRDWRKNRRPVNLLCYGADPNRNWDSHFGEHGVSQVQCSLTYPGPYAFSEIEVKTLSDYIATVPRLTTYISFHAFSQILLLPYGHTKEHLDNYDNAMAIGRKGLEALSTRFGTEYTIGNIADAIYMASGGSIDWVKATLKTPLSYCYELRDKGTHGFMLPADQIISTAIETFTSIQAILEEGFAYGYHDV